MKSGLTFFVITTSFYIQSDARTCTGEIIQDLGTVMGQFLGKSTELFNKCEVEKRREGITGLNMNREKEKGTLCKIESCRNVYIEYEKALNTVGDCDIAPGQSYIDIVTKNLPGGKFCGTAATNTAAISGSNAKNGRDQINESNKQASTVNINQSNTQNGASGAKTPGSDTVAISGSNAKNGRDQINESNKQAPTLIFMVLGIVVLGHFVLL